MDKFYHFIGCMIIAFFCGFGVAMLAGVAKEFFYDGIFKKGQEDIKDIYADTLGALTGAYLRAQLGGL